MEGGRGRHTGAVFTSQTSKDKRGCWYHAEGVCSEVRLQPLLVSVGWCHIQSYLMRRSREAAVSQVLPLGKRQACSYVQPLKSHILASIPSHCSKMRVGNQEVRIIGPSWRLATLVSNFEGKNLVPNAGLNIPSHDPLVDEEMRLTEA